MESQYVLAKIELPILINSDGTYKIENEYTNITFASLSELPPKQSKKQIELSELLTQLGGNTQLTTKITLDKLNYDDEESKGLIFRTNINNDDNDDCNTSIVMSSLEQKTMKTESISVTEGGKEQIISMYIPNKNGNPRKRNNHGTTFKNTQHHTNKYTRRLY
jgi:hypothetical protein